jgi:starvation-inducible DNA-binding protein
MDQVKIKETRQCGDGNVYMLHLPAAKAFATDKALSDFLASTYVLYHKSLCCQWGMTALNFIKSNKILDDHCQDLLHATGMITRRLRAMGYSTARSLASLVETSSVMDEEHSSTFSGMIENLEIAHNICLNEAMYVLQGAKADGDKMTESLMMQRVRFHNKALLTLNTLL